MASPQSTPTAPRRLAVSIRRLQDASDRGAIAAALRRRTPQIVILGAGYDTRALRIPGIETALVYEVDHPDTQAFKRARLGADMETIQKHVRFVDVDGDRRPHLRDP